MVDSVTAKDMQVISDAVLDGSIEINKLPGNAQMALADYWGSAGIDINKPDDPTTQAQLAELTKQRAEAAAGGSIFDSPIFKPIEWIGSKIYQAYSATISPAISSALMAAHSVAYGRPDYIGQDGEWDALKDYWDLSHHISPGQAVWELGLNNKELKDRGISPDQMAYDQKLALQGKYHDKPTPNDPFGIKTASEEYFGSGASKYVTGATDFAVSWYADPLVLAGKGAGIAKKAAFTRPVERQLGKAGLPEERFEQFSQTSKFQSMVDQVMKIKRANPETAALNLRRDFPTVSKSANGDSLARLLAQAKDGDEVSDILRVSMGDNGGKTALEVRNLKISGQLDTLTKQNVAHGQYYDGMTDAQKASTKGQRVKAALDAQTDYISRLNAQSRIIDDKLDAFGTVDNMNFNRVTTPLGMKVRSSEALQGGGFKKVRGAGIIRGAAALVYNPTIGMPVKVIRSYSDIKPTHYIDVHGENSYKELDASLRDSGISREEREKHVADYVAATPNERQAQLMNMEQSLTYKMIDRYNAKHPNDPLTYEMAKDLYRDFAQRRKSGQAAAASTKRSYGAAEMPDPNNPGRSIRVAEIDTDGSSVVSTPIFDTQLANSHVLMDFKAMERAIDAHGSAFQRLKSSAGDKWAQGVGVADTLNSIWKFAQLFRLGYAPRALADDFLGQVARFGSLSMMERAARGAKVSLEDFVRGKWTKNSVETARQNQGMLAQHIEELSGQQAYAKNEVLRAQARGSEADLQVARDMYKDVSDEIEEAKIAHSKFGRLVAAGSQMRDVKIGRQVFAPAFGGKQGELYRDLASGDRNFGNLMGSSADWYLKRMRRQDWENITPASRGNEAHMDAWIRHVNDQIGQSSIGKQVLAGKSENELVAWMRNTPEGQKYRHDIGLKNISDYELAQRVKAQVDYVLDPTLPGIDAARQAILQGKLERSMLEGVPVANRPMINAETFRYAEGTSPLSQLLDKSITGWYNIANQIPARKLLRNPLFGQSYKAHLKSSMKVLEAQGVTHIDEATRKALESAARKGALKDVKDFTFTMDHETKMAYMMRHFGAFFGAQQESWNRWARIISDKPDVLARVPQVYGAPTRAGMTVDQNGNTIDAAGYSTDPVTGERKLVKYSDRKMLIQIPEYLGGKKVNEFLGLDPDASFVVPMSSMNIVMNTGDGALPVGAGPFIQIAANHFAKEDPKFADWSRKLGLLPFGPQDSWTNFINPTTGKRLGEATDDMGETKQRALFYAMQVENYKYEQGLRDKPPTWKELEDRADRWTIFRTAAAWVLPFSVNGQDPYQFFRDEYSRYQKLDANSADEKFYDKYGDSFYAFTQSMSKNNTGLRPTAESVKMSKYYQDLIDKVGPEYAGLVVGHEGDGVFSQGAYFYQKTHAAAAGSNVTQRQNMSAREAWNESNKARGWMQYRSFVDDLNSQLFERGLHTFDDEGAEDLKDTRTALVSALTEQYFPDGTVNPYYNESWEKEFNSLDKGKYDRTAYDLTELVNDPELWAKAVNPDGTVGIRSDIYTLKTYLNTRKQMQVALAARKAEGGSDDITAQSNYDLKNSWDTFTMGLIEADTKFSWIHSRFFATDMGFSMDTSYTKEEQEAMDQSNATTEGQTAIDMGTQPSILDTLQQGGDEAYGSTGIQ